MSTTYYIADSRHLNPEDLTRAEKLNLPEARICTIAATKIGGVKVPAVIMYMPLEQIAQYADDVCLARNNGGGVLTMGELKPLIEGGVKIAERDYLEMHREDIQRMARRLLGREIEPYEDLTSLFG